MIVHLLVVISSVCFLSKGDNSSGTEVQKDVIVVGGGIAGLAAARTLVNAGKFSVTVLEARRERYGGRIFTDRKSFNKAKGIEVDLGPNWLNSMIKDNPLTKIISDEELEVKSVGKVQLHFTEKDQVFTGDDANKIFTEFYQVTMNAIEKIQNSGKDMELKKAIHGVIRNQKTTTEKELLLSVLNSHHMMSLPDHSSQQFIPKKEFGWDTGVVDGFDQIVDVIAGGKATERPLDIELRKPVRQVAVDKKIQKVLIRTRDLKQYKADAVVIALPLGVLKTDTVIFDPPLPKGWKKSIESLGIGYSNKLVLQFDKVFWPEDVGVFTMVTSNQNEAGMLQTWINLHRYVKTPMLMGVLHDEAAVRFENMTDDEIKENAVNILSKLFGKEIVQGVQVTIVTKSKWISDNKVVGTSTYPKVGVLPEMFDMLTEPVCPCIYFAGEYTSLENMNTAHGAYLSGVKAAEQIISNLCEKKVKIETSSVKEKEQIETKDKKSDEKTKKEKLSKGEKKGKDDKNKLKDEL